MVLFALQANAQVRNSYQVNVGSYVGNEENIFKGPDFLYDKKTEEYLDMDTVLVSDQFTRFEYDASYKHVVLKKHEYGIRALGWMQKYFSNKRLDQSTYSFEGFYTKRLSKKFKVGTDVDFGVSDRIGTNVRGEELIRSLEYRDLRSNTFLRYWRNKKLVMVLNYELHNKDFHKDTSSTPFDYIQHRLDYSIDRTFYKGKKRKAMFGAEIAVADRQYLKYLAADSNGRKQADAPTRVLKYLEFGTYFDYTISKKFSAEINFKQFNRRDMHVGFFSYNRSRIGAKLRFKHKGFFVTYGPTYNYIQFAVKTAHMFEDDADPLVYNKIVHGLKVRYRVNDRLNIRAALNVESRQSNTEMDDRITRRGYNHNSVQIGLTYDLIDKTVKKKRDLRKNMF